MKKKLCIYQTDGTFPSSKYQCGAKPSPGRCSGCSASHLKGACYFFLSLDYFAYQSLVFPGDLSAGGNKSKQDAFANIPCSFDLRGTCQEMERLARLPEKTVAKGLFNWLLFLGTVQISLNPFFPPNRTGVKEIQRLS